ncbi:TrbC/VIRB2 family protein [Aliarcobacter thereius]|uniref:TrbC/VirB2 family protein n=1 Tax=Aliarcobacter thereius TaxID=544718 RepID=UPI000828B643|nr:TrbC/VirB2 family protein [Aliarcobacter thereius]OCL86000.1 TrbC/VIRB2 family protein [Aliarcobacter thereius]
MKKLNFLFISLLFPIFSFAAKIDVTKSISAIDSFIEVLTSGVLRSVLTLIIIVVGYMYLFNKGNIAKEWLIAILIGSFFILSASFIAGVFV